MGATKPVDDVMELTKRSATPPQLILGKEVLRRVGAIFKGVRIVAEEELTYNKVDNMGIATKAPPALIKAVLLSKSVKASIVVVYVICDKVANPTANTPLGDDLSNLLSKVDAGMAALHL